MLNQLFIIIIITCVILFPLLSHPLSIGLTLLLLVIVLALNLTTLYSYLWLSYILVLILLGGLLVIFIYIALVATNETFMAFKISTPVVGGVFIFIGIFFISDSLYSTKESQQGLLSWNRKGLEFITQFYSWEINFITLFLLFYLLLTLIVVVFNTKNNVITLRSSFYVNPTLYSPPLENSKPCFSWSSSASKYFSLMEFWVSVRIMLNYTTSNRIVFSYTLYSSYWSSLR